MLALLFGVLVTGKTASAQDSDPGGAPSTTQNIDPKLYSNNPSCTDLGHDYGYKIDGKPFYGPNVGDGVLKVTTTGSGDKYFDWTSNIGVDTVIVKGGQNSDAFVYDPGKGEVRLDTGLHAPVNPKNNEPYDLSHIEFCYDLELKVSKTAETSFTRTHNWDIDKSVDRDSLDLFRGDSAKANYTVQATKTGFNDSAFAVSGKITITNPNPMDVIVTSVTDQISGSPSTTAQVTCKDASGTTVPLPGFPLAPGATLVCDYSASLGDKSDRTNTATASGIVSGKIFRDGVGKADVKFGNPTKVVNDKVNVDDDLATPDDATDDKKFAFGSSGSEAYERTFSCDADEGTHTNTATLIGDDAKELGSDEASVTVNCYDLDVSKTAETSFTRTHNWDIDKSVDRDSLDLFRGDSAKVNYSVEVTKDEGGPTDSEHAVNGKITVTNPAPMDATLSSVKDAFGGKDAEVSCPDSTVPANNGELVCDYTIGFGDEKPADGTNTASATLENGTGFSGEAAVSFGDSAAKIEHINDKINVDDTFAGSGSPWTFSDSGEVSYERTFSCDADSPASKQHDNTATVLETEQSDDASVTLNCHDLDVSKTADTSFTRTFDWAIDKSVDRSTLDLFRGDSAKVNYSVKLAATSEDSNHAVSGRITVTNPAPIDANLASISDQISGISEPVEVECRDANGNAVAFPYTLGDGESLECSYSSGLDDKATRTNTATATLQNNTGDTTPFSGEATVSFANANMTQVKDKINVDDTFAGSGSPWIFDANDATETFERTYERTFSCDADKGTHPNTATIRDTDLSDTASVTVNCHELNVEKTAQTSFTRTHNWDVEKKVNGKDNDTLDLFKGNSGNANYTVEVKKTDTDNDYAVSGTIIVSNDTPINAPLAGVSDQISGVSGAVKVDCGVSFPYTLGDGESLECSYSSGLDDKTTRLNTATATLENGTGFAGTADITFGAPTKVVNQSVTVEDTVQGNLGTFSESGPAQPYGRAFSCDQEGLNPNTATVIGDGGQVLDSDTASVRVNCHDLTVTKDAKTSFTRTYTWAIDKSADQSDLTLSAGQNYLVNYLVKLNATSADSGYKVRGEITVSNPAPMPASLASVTDAVSGGIAGDVKCLELTVPAGGTLTCTYEATLPDAADRENIATATLQNNTGGTTAFSSAPFPVSFTNAAVDTVDESIAVNDSLQGNLGTVTAGTDALPKTFNYSRYVGPYSASGTYNVDNVASFVTNDTGTRGSDTWRVVVHVPATGVGCTLTIGYWKTHAGFTGNNPDMVSKYLPIWLGTAGSKTKSVKVTTATQAVSILDKAGDSSNGINKLYAQLLAAKLNIASGADSTDVSTTISAADTFLAKYNGASWSTLSNTDKQRVLSWATKLDNFNNGLIGPGHCSEEQTTST